VAGTSKKTAHVKRLLRLFLLDQDLKELNGGKAQYRFFGNQKFYK
jgi:hypothetical protein